MFQRRSSAAAVLLLVPCDPCRADVAPTVFVGSGITVAESTTIEMKSAAVEIVWGRPCKLSATFEMVNRSPTSEKVAVGFPIPVMEHGLSPKPGSVSISFDGEDAEVVGPKERSAGAVQRRTGGSLSLYFYDWFVARHAFAPGPTSVVVEADLNASMIYGEPHQESIYYTIWTGAKWHGKIGSEEVSIVFPDTIAAEQIEAAAPPGYRVDGNTVRWSFQDFEPEELKDDIGFSYYAPDAMRVIRRLREFVLPIPNRPTTASTSRNTSSPRVSINPTRAIRLSG